MDDKLAGVTSEAVRDATGDDWDGWLAHLDDRDGTTMSHKERVATLADTGVESTWWRQTLAVGYEQARGLREVGETADAGFEIGVQRTMAVSADDLWSLLKRRPDLWLGEIDAVSFEPGTTYETDDGIVGEMRTLAPGERLRLTWHPDRFEAPSTLQLTLEAKMPAKTVLRVHHERLANGEVREAMRERWRSVLDDVQAAAEA